MALTKKAKIGIGVGITIFVLLAIGILLFVLGLGGVFGRTVGHFPCSYEKIVKDVDLLPKFIKEDGLRENYENYEGKFTIYPQNGLVNNKDMLKGKEPVVGYELCGSIGTIYGWAIRKEDDKEEIKSLVKETFGEYGEMAENTGVKSTWGGDIYFLPDRELYLNKYRAVLYCDYIVNNDLFYRYAFFPNTEEISTEQAIEMFNKIFVLI